jgi:RNA 3'-terminal phosphate cyclase
MKRRTFAHGLAALSVTPAQVRSAEVVTAQLNATPAAWPVTSAYTVHVLHAGSLTVLIQEGLAPAATAGDLIVIDTRGGSDEAPRDSPVSVECATLWRQVLVS